MAQLATKAQARLYHAFRPATQKGYLCMFKEFLGFLAAAGFHLTKVNHLVLLDFMEYIVQNKISPSGISNYLAGIRAQCIVFDLDTSYFQHQQIQYFFKSLKIKRPSQSRIHKTIDIQLITNLIHITNTLEHPNLFNSLYILAYFSLILPAIWQKVTL